MTNDVSNYRRVLRRETHASRTIAAVVVASVTLAVLIAVIVVGIGWLAAPAFRDGVTDAVGGIAELAQQQAVLLAVGVVLVLLSLVLLALAMIPGRRARRARTTDRAALVVDDGVIADSVADQVVRRVGVGRRQVSVTVERSITTVRITPTSGLLVDRIAAESAVVETLSGIGFTTAPRIIVAEEGVIA